MSDEELRIAALNAAAEVVAGMVGSGRYAGSEVGLSTLKMADKFWTFIETGAIER